MDNETLCRLIREALHSPEQAEVLALAIDQIPEVRAYIGQGLSPYYAEALLATQRDIQRNIRKFPQKYKLNLETLDYKNPSEIVHVKKYFIEWVVMILRRDCYDVRRRITPLILSLDEIIDGSSLITRGDIIADNTRSGIKKLIEQELNLIGEQLRLYIQEDPERKLRDCHIRDHPDINCQVLLQLRFLSKPSLTLQNIAQRLQSNPSTIKSRLERNCLPLIRNIVLNLGYDQLL